MCSYIGHVNSRLDMLRVGVKLALGSVVVLDSEDELVLPNTSTQLLNVVMTQASSLLS